MAAKLVEVVRAHGLVVDGERHAEVTASVGITAVRGAPALDAAHLLIEADVAMYQAKDAGKGGIAVHAPGGSEHAAA